MRDSIPSKIALQISRAAEAGQVKPRMFTHKAGPITELSIAINRHFTRRQLRDAVDATISRILNKCGKMIIMLPGPMRYGIVGCFDWAEMIRQDKADADQPAPARIWKRHRFNWSPEAITSVLPNYREPSS